MCWKEQLFGPSELRALHKIRFPKITTSAQAPALAGLSLALISISPGKEGKLEIKPQLVYQS
jgi:hypothetical protein